MGAAKVQAVQVQVQCEINDLIEKETDTRSSLSSMAPLCLFDPYPAPTSLRFPQPCSAQASASPRLPVTSPASEIASDVQYRVAISSLDASPRPNRASYTQVIICSSYALPQLRHF